MGQREDREDMRQHSWEMASRSVHTDLASLSPSLTDQEKTLRNQSFSLAKTQRSAPTKMKKTDSGERDGGLRGQLVLNMSQQLQFQTIGTIWRKLTISR